MHMVIRQFFVPAPRPRQARRAACIFSALALFLAGCSDRTADAYAEAQTAQALLQQGDLPGARQAIGRAMALREDQVDILLLDAQIKAAMGDVQAAYTSYRMVLALDPRRPEALLGVAQLGMALGDEREALKAADTMLTIAPENVDALLIKGIAALADKDYDEAIALGERMIAAEPGNRRGIVLKARGYSLTGRRDEALALLRKAAEEFGNDELIATAMLENARDNGEVATMLEQFALLRQARPGSVDLAIDEINVRYKSGDRDGARAAAGAMIAQFGTDARAMQRLARLWDEYDPDPLLPADRSAMAESGAINARVFAARHYLRNGAPNVAAELVGRSPDVRARALLARIAARLDEDGAIRAAAGILSQDRTSCDALLAAAEWNLAAGKPGETVKSAQVAAAECRDMPDGYLVAARAYDALRRPAGAERIYREGIAAHPDDRALTRAYARWLLRRGREGAAESVARRLTDRVPARASSWKLLEQTCLAIGNSSCVAEARRGATAAAKNFAIDLPPGERSRNPLLGQEWR